MGKTEGRFLLHFEASDQIAKNRPYRITLEDGRVVEGVSDEKGLTSLVGDDLLKIMNLEIGAPENPS
jgi:type VI secretion system secreted protein VgrG